MSGSTERLVTRFENGEPKTATDALVVEEPVEFRLNDVPIAVLMRTPGDDEALARGFVLSESIVLHPDEFTTIQPAGADGDDRWDIVLRPDVVVNAEQFRRNTYTTSSCGVCGKASIDAVRIAAPAAASGPEVDRATVVRLPDMMRKRQAEFDRTGGIHAAAAFSADGELLAIREDVGRHNAVDKLIGEMASRRWPLHGVILVVSGRISFEIVQKAAVVGIPIVCGVSAASSLAAELGAELGMTVIGFVRDGTFNVYSGAERVISF
ncbi:MAG: formate dehydrogenase accessory sulfurtransferase FdhD [Acidimicrobiia bacterium]|nr:formate dehydrogenase accessory sulfurtransferase FdhD [Acidimicrobiia bacterium]